MSASSTLLVLGVLCLDPGPSVPSEPKSGPDDGEVMLRLIDHHAHEARRERLVRGSFGIASAGAQLGLGIYGRVALNDTGTGMRRSSVGQMVAGSLGLLGSTSQLAVRSTLERLRSSPSYGELAADSTDPVALATLRLDWERAARRARSRRYVRGGLDLAVGSLLTTAASVRLARANSETTNGERLWAYTTLASALGLAVAGAYTLILPSETERSYAAYEAGHSRRRPRARVTPGPGGIAIRGRF